MILVLLIVIPAAGGLLAWLLERFNPSWPKYAAFVVMTAELAAAIYLAFYRLGSSAITFPWIPQFGIGIFLASDGLSLVLVLLTGFLGLMAVASAWTEINDRTGFFYFNLLLTLAGITGVFLSLDSFSFLFFLGDDAHSHVFPYRHMGP